MLQKPIQNQNSETKVQIEVKINYTSQDIKIDSKIVVQLRIKIYERTCQPRSTKMQHGAYWSPLFIQIKKQNFDKIFTLDFNDTFQTKGIPLRKN